MESNVTAGRDHLARRNDASVAKGELPEINDVLVVEDEKIQAERLMAVLRLVLGREEVAIRTVPTLDRAIDAVLEKVPDVVFLDDYLRPNDSALQTIPMLERAGFKGPIIVISGEIDRQRSIALKSAGACETVHKDHVDSVRLSEALAKAFAAGH